MKTLDQEEKEVLDAYESGKLRRVPESKKEIACHKRYAAATFKKDARINIRISSKDLKELQKFALSEGLPYQTLISSVLYKFAERRLTTRSSRRWATR
ncbi:MAG: antitoxin [Nitrospira sp. LK70]|nr:antitoxin [Nitrospira sp. LK70]